VPVAGVINLITKNEYNGADITHYWGISEHGDAETYHGSLVGGVSHKLWDDNSKLSIVIAFDYYEQGPILAADRPYSANPDHSDINQNLKLYYQLLIQRNEETAETPNQGFSSGDINAFSLFEIPTTNPFNRTGASVSPDFPGMFLPELGAWNSDVIIRTIRNVVGATLQLPHDWVIDANFQYAESDGTQYIYNAINKQRLSQAVAGELPGHIGQFFNPFIDERFAGNFNRQFYNALRTIQWEDVRTSVLTGMFLLAAL
jgi:hypothetical protein